MSNPPPVWPSPLHLAVVLVEPAGALNVGSVARLCANFSSAHLQPQLRLVAPRCDHNGAEARRMAVHGQALLASAQLFDDLAAALADRTAVVATSGRGEGEPLEVQGPDQALAWLLGHQGGAQRPALVFGREDRGLSTDELLQAGALLQIGTGPDYRSLNLSHAVGVVLHALHRLLLQPLAQPPGQQPTLAPRSQIEAMLADAETLLLDVGFLLPHTASARMAKLRALLQRAGLSPEDTALLRGMVRQCRWAAGRGGQTS